MSSIQRDEDKTKDQLINELMVLRRRIAALEVLEIEHKQAEEALRERLHDLGEWVKELNCLYGIADLVEESDTSIERIVKGTVDLVRQACQYPEITCARVVLEGQELMTNNFKETACKQVCDIMVHDRRSGTLEVCLLEEKRGGR